MIVIHERSDDHVFAGWLYFSAWRQSRNYLLLLDALSRVHAAEREWLIAVGDKPMRREWHVLRRCISRGLVRLRDPLNCLRRPKIEPFVGVAPTEN